MLLMQTMAWEQYLADYFTLLTQFFFGLYCQIFILILCHFTVAHFSHLVGQCRCAFVQMIRILQVFCNILWN